MAKSSTGKNSPDAETLFQQAAHLHGQGKLAEAEVVYEKLLKTHPKHVNGLHMRGALFHQMGRVQDSVASIEQAAELDPDDPALMNNFGNALKDAARFDEAHKAYDRAIELKPDYAEAHTNKGILWRALLKNRKAAECFVKAMELDPKDARPAFSLGNIYVMLRRYEEAYACFARAHSLDPDIEMLTGSWLLMKQQLGDWENWEETYKRMVDGFEAGRLTAHPFGTLTTPLPAMERRRYAELYCSRVYPDPGKSYWNGERYNHDKIRIGYLSADFREHAVSYLTAEIYEYHDRSRFEVHGFSVHPGKPCEIRTRLENAFDHFYELTETPDQDVAQLIRDLEIDILIDLGGHTAGARTGVVLYRPAPAQISYLGFPGTMGASFIDYIIADERLIPPDQQDYYSEKVVYLPECYQPSDTRRKVASKIPSRADLGLKEDAFVFCSFNNTFKITPDIFDVWMRILKRTEGSQLWLVELADRVKTNFAKEAEKRGVSGDRIVFASHAPYPEHLARHKCADLFLDCFHYNAGTMASEALWMELPLLTMPGDNFSKRMASSLLTTLGLDELIVPDLKTYEDRAVALAQNPAELARIRDKLSKAKQQSPLFDMARYTKNLEAAYEQIADRSRKGLSPDHIFVGKQPVESRITLPAAPVSALYKKAAQLHAAGKQQQAAEAYRRLLKRDPDHADGLHYYGNLLSALGQKEDAVRYLAKATTLAPENFAVLNNYGNALRDTGQTNKALPYLRKATELAPDHYGVRNNLANVLKLLGHYEEALTHYDKAIEIEPTDASLYFNKGAMLRNLKRYRASNEALSKAVELAPDLDQLPGSWLLGLQAGCDWTDWEKAVRLVTDGIEAEKLITASFPPLACPIPAPLKKRAAETYTAKIYPPARRPMWQGEAYDHPRLRIGYLSYDFRQHPVSYLTAEMLERHDRERFETYGFSLSPSDRTNTRKRMEKAFDHFHDVSGRGDRDIAKMIHHSKIDVLVDINGHTLGARTNILAHRPAPLQVSYLGFPGTMGADYIDYIIADATLIPQEHWTHYTEKILTLPDCYQPTDTNKPQLKNRVSRADYGLDPDAFVFCSFNTNFKITPDAYDIWMRILHSVDNSQFWLVDKSGEVNDFLLAEAKARGIEKERIVFAKTVSYQEHLARHRCADLMLDTLYYNAGTVASDALWMGLPILTTPGDSFSSRMATSLLTTIGVPELIAPTREDYEQTAGELAQNPDRLAAIKKKIEERRSTSPLFDMELYTKNLEAGYRAITRRSRRGRPPAHMTIGRAPR